MTSVRTGLILAIIVCHALNIILALPWLTTTGALLIAALAVACLPNFFKDINGYMMLAMFLLAAVLMIRTGARPAQWATALTQFEWLFPFAFTIRLLAFPITLGQYPRAFNGLMHYAARSNAVIHVMVMLVACALSTVTLTAAIPVVYAMFSQGGVGDLASDYFLITSARRGYVLAMIYTPLSATMATALLITQAPYSKLLPLSLALGVAGIAASLITYKLNGTLAKTSIKLQALPAGEGPHTAYKLVEFLLGIGGVLLGYALLVKYAGLSALDAISAVALVGSVLWCLALRRWRGYVAEVRRYLTREISLTYDQYLLYAASGFLTFALTRSGLAGAIGTAFANAGHFFGFIKPAFLVAPAVLLLSAIGVHPLTALATVGTAVTAMPGGLHDPYVAFGLVSGAALGYILSPFSPPTLMASSTVQQPPFRLVRWDMGFGLLFILAVTILM